MRRTGLALLLIAHGLAHGLAGMRAADGAHPWLTAGAWAVALVGFTTAGAVLLGVRGPGGTWRRYAAAGIVGSVVLLLVGWHSPLAGVGFLLDGYIASLLLRRRPHRGVIGSVGPLRAVPRAVDLVALTALFLLGAVVMARPWQARWGSTDAELRAALPGDDPVLVPTYRLQHAVTIHAPPERIWPWLAQLGEDRGGFYSYAVLERLIGLHVRNAERIHPEWQGLATGDTVYATHAGWLGQQRRFGWRVREARRDTVLVLENWGSFVLVPVGPGTTRLIVRTWGAQPDDIAGVVLAPVGFLGFEPLHFLMQRRMLLTLKARAEETGHTGAIHD